MRGFEIDFFKNMDLGRIELPTFKVGLFAEVPSIVRGEFNVERKFGDILSYNFKSQSAQVTMYMRGAYTDLYFGRDVQLLSCVTSSFNYNPVFTANSNTELKIKGFIGVRPQIALYIPLFSARISADTGAEIEGKDELGENAFPPVTDGVKFGECKTCHHHEVEVTGL